MTQNSLQIPNELKERKQWVVWRLEENQAGALKKVPYQAGFRGHASTTNPSTWCSFEMALASCGGKLTPQQGIGFVFNGTYVGIDFDFKSTNGRPTKEQQDRAKTLDSYTEISPSGKGWHVIVKGNLAGRAGLNSEVLEIYDEGRYFTFTGQLLSSNGWNTIKERSQVVQKIYDCYKQPDKALHLDLRSQGCGTPKSGLVHEGTRDSTLANWAMVATRLEKQGTIQGDLETLLCELAATTFDIDAKGQQGIEGLKQKLASARKKIGAGKGGVSCMSSNNMGETKEIQWIWPQRIPAGCMTMIAGPQDAKKSFYAAHLAACLTAGTDWPDGQTNANGKLRVGVLTNEGMVMHYEWRRRAVISGAFEPNLFFFPTAEQDDPTSHAPDLQTEFDDIVEAVTRYKFDVLIIDSLSGGHNLKENSAAMRKLLKPLSTAMPGVTTIVIHHARKQNENESAKMTLDRVRGSTTITQYCRSVIGLRPVGTNDSQEVVIKSNFGPKPPGMLVQIDGDAKTLDYYGLRFTETEPEEVVTKKLTAVDQAFDFIEKMTAGGPQKYTDLIRAGAAHTPRISESAIIRAGKRFAISKTPEGLWKVTEFELRVGGLNPDPETTSHSLSLPEVQIFPAPVPLTEEDV